MRDFCDIFTISCVCFPVKFLVHAHSKLFTHSATFTIVNNYDYHDERDERDSQMLSFLVGSHKKTLKKVSIPSTHEIHSRKNRCTHRECRTYERWSSQVVKFSFLISFCHVFRVCGWVWEKWKNGMFNAFYNKCYVMCLSEGEWKVSVRLEQLIKIFSFNFCLFFCSSCFHRRKSEKKKITKLTKSLSLFYFFTQH